MSTPATIVLADDHLLVREGLCALIQLEPDLTVVGEAEDGDDAVTLVMQLRPDVLVLDLVMPRMSGFEVMYRLQAQGSPTRIVVLSAYPGRSHVLQALRAGAHAYLAKTEAWREVVQAMHEVLAGRRYLGSSLNVGEIADLRDDAPAVAGATLTPREHQVLVLSAHGRTAQDIATALAISSRTVETHRQSFMRKLGLRSQTDLVRYAISVGIVAA